MATTTIPELLAPAGDRESLQAAVNHGADSVYLGLRSFSARARAVNFTVEELGEITAEVRPRGVRVYVALNTLTFDRDLPAVRRLVADVARAGADALIVQDLGVAAVAREVCPELPLHASTQTSVGSAAGCAVLEDLGFERVIAPRELDLDQLAALSKATGLQVEAFVHGALCMSWSGQCLASLHWGGRSGNRGQCAQPCRLPAEVFVDGHPVGAPAHPLSPTDLLGSDRVDALCRTGIAALKIEGRLKHAAFVAAAVHHYRRLLDRCAAGTPIEGDEQERWDLLQPFARATSRGYLDGPDHLALVADAPPGHRGLRVGEVLAARGRSLRIGGVVMPLEAGDGIGVGDPGDEERAGGRVHAVESHQGGELVVRMGPGFEAARVRPGFEVRRTDHPALTRRLRLGIEGRSREARPRREPVQMRLVGRAGEPAGLVVQDGAGHVVEVESAAPLEVARNRPLEADDARRRVARLGNTPFRLDGFRFDVHGEAAIAPAELNRMRREACVELARLRARPPARVVHAAPVARREAVKSMAPLTPPGLAVLCRQPRQVDAAAERGVATILCESRSIVELGEMLARARAAGALAVAALPRTVGSGEEAGALAAVALEPDGLLIRTLAELRAAAVLDARSRPLLLGDASLNVVNARAFGALLAQGLASLAPGHDADAGEVLALVEHGVDAARLEVVLRSRVPLLHTAHCLFAARVASAADARRCGEVCARSELSLRSSRGDLPVLADELCRNTVFSADERDWSDHRSCLHSAGIRRFRIEFVDEISSQVHARIADFTT